MSNRKETMNVVKQAKRDREIRTNLANGDVIVKFRGKVQRYKNGYIQGLRETIKITEKDYGGKNWKGQQGPYPLIAQVFIKNGEDIHPVIIYRIGDAAHGYMPTQDDLLAFRKLLIDQAGDPGSAVIMHYGLKVALEYIPTWLIKLDNVIRKIVWKLRIKH